MGCQDQNEHLYLEHPLSCGGYKFVHACVTYSSSILRKEDKHTVATVDTFKSWTVNGSIVVR